MSIKVGDIAPAFTLPGTGGRSYSLSDFAGKPLVIAFYPGDDTPVCTKQLNAYNNDFEEFENLDAAVIGISAQDIASHEAFAADLGVRALATAYTSAMDAEVNVPPVVGETRDVVTAVTPVTTPSGAVVEPAPVANAAPSRRSFASAMSRAS